MNTKRGVTLVILSIKLTNYKGYDLLGYHITLQGFSPSQKTQEKALENAKQRYAQGGLKSLLEYLQNQSFVGILSAQLMCL